MADKERDPIQVLMCSGDSLWMWETGSIQMASSKPIAVSFQHLAKGEIPPRLFGESLGTTMMAMNAFASQIHSPPTPMQRLALAVLFGDQTAALVLAGEVLMNFHRTENRDAIHAKREHHPGAHP